MRVKLKVSWPIAATEQVPLVPVGGAKVTHTHTHRGGVEMLKLP